jgi:putative restriction endonuclease
MGAQLNEGLFSIMQDEDGRETLREKLLQSCFSLEAAAVLREQSAINREAFAYSRILEKKRICPW